MVQRNRETQLVIRCTWELREEVEELAKKDGQSLAEWMRRAVQEKIERDKHDLKDDELEKKIESVLKKMLAELNK